MEKKVICYQLWDRKITCQCFDWMLQSSLLPWWQLEHSVETSASYSLISKLVTDNLLFHTILVWEWNWVCCYCLQDQTCRESNWSQCNRNTNGHWWTFQVWRKSSVKGKLIKTNWFNQFLQVSWSSHTTEVCGSRRECQRQRGHHQDLL